MTNINGVGTGGAVGYNPNNHTVIKPAGTNYVPTPRNPMTGKVPTATDSAKNIIDSIDFRTQVIHLESGEAGSLREALGNDSSGDNSLKGNVDKLDGKGMYDKSGEAFEAKPVKGGNVDMYG